MFLLLYPGFCDSLNRFKKVLQLRSCMDGCTDTSMKLECCGEITQSLNPRGTDNFLYVTYVFRRSCLLLMYSEVFAVKLPPTVYIDTRGVYICVFTERRRVRPKRRTRVSQKGGVGGLVSSTLMSVPGGLLSLCAQTGINNFMIGIRKNQFNGVYKDLRGG